MNTPVPERPEAEVCDFFHVDVQIRSGEAVA
eukprot:SAG31_NODE_9386_length_1286_cov_1.101938_1_plen_30_part_10